MKKAVIGISEIKALKGRREKGQTTKSRHYICGFKLERLDVTFKSTPFSMMSGGELTCYTIK